jgi:phosphoserine phosphatase
LTNKLAIFDFDSTLMDGETIDILADELGIKEQIEKITHKTMSGEIDFFESLTKRVSLLKGLEYKKAIDICQNLPLMNGAKDTIKALKQRGYKVICFSGGFTIATSYARDILELDGDFANILHHKNGNLTGLVGGYMMFNDSKGDMLLRLQKLLNVDIKDTLVVGDGANDKSMFAYANKKVAFVAHDILKKEANIIIDKKDLTLI